MDIVEKLRSQIGDDVKVILDRDALLREAADEIERLRGAVDSMADFDHARDAAEDHKNHLAFLQRAQ